MGSGAAALPTLHEEEFQIGKLYNISVNDNGRTKTYKKMTLQHFEDDEDGKFYAFISKAGGMTVSQEQINNGYIEIQESKENIFTARPSLLIPNSSNAYRNIAAMPGVRALTTTGKRAAEKDPFFSLGLAAMNSAFEQQEAAKKSMGGKGRRTTKRHQMKRRKSRRSRR